MLRAEATVDLTAVGGNVAHLRQEAGGAEVMAVVKADAYGHGALPCARAALEAGATWLAVALVEEALPLRAAALRVPVLALLPPMGRAREAVDAGVDLAVHGRGDLTEVADAARAAGRRARVHLKADTGLGRGGATPEAWPELVEAAAGCPDVEVVGVWSHLACADTPGHPSVAAQLRAYDTALGVARAAGLDPLVRHLANSAATLAVPDARLDLVRPGIAVYGLSPFADRAPVPGLRPAMTLRARVAVTKRLPAGHGVGYGHRHVTAWPTTTAVVPLGYADGIPRGATGTAELLLAGRRRRIAGTVSMDQVVVEVGDDPVAPGDEALLFGPGDQGEPTADDWAAALGTIGYEVTTRLGPRVPRRHVGSAA